MHAKEHTTWARYADAFAYASKLALAYRYRPIAFRVERDKSHWATPWTVVAVTGESCERIAKHRRLWISKNLLESAGWHSGDNRSACRL